MRQHGVGAEERLAVFVGGHGRVALLEGGVPDPHHSTAHQQDRLVTVGPLCIVH